MRNNELVSLVKSIPVTTVNGVDGLLYGNIDNVLNDESMKNHLWDICFQLTIHNETIEYLLNDGTNDEFISLDKMENIVLPYLIKNINNVTETESWF